MQHREYSDWQSPHGGRLTLVLETLAEESVILITFASLCSSGILDGIPAFNVQYTVQVYHLSKVEADWSPEDRHPRQDSRRRPHDVYWRRRQLFAKSAKNDIKRKKSASESSMVMLK